MADEREETDVAAEGETPAGGQGKKFFLVGLLGAAAGAVTALLLTPWRGAEARAKVKEGASKAGAAAKEGASKAAAAAREGAAKAAEAAKAAGEKAAQTARRARDRASGREESEAD
jgi:gas vesicle protein